MPRTSRIAPGGTIFHCLNRGNNRNEIFAADGDFAAFECTLEATLELVPVRLLGYCLMPNHWRLLLWPKKDGDLSAFMHRLTTTHVRRWHRHRHSDGYGHLYQGRYVGCWKSRIEPLGDGDEKDRDLCEMPVTLTSGKKLPKCLDMIAACDVTAAIERFGEFDRSKG